MSDIVKGILIAVGSMSVSGALAWLWVVFSERGQKLWTNLGRVQGLRAVAVVAVVALLLAIVGTSLPFLLRYETVMVAVEPHRIGPTGEQTPERTKQQGGNESYFQDTINQVVPESAKRLCMISTVRFDAPKGECILTHRGGDQAWQITSHASCQVTCFDLTVSR